jgi:hypothetical protein
MSELGIGSRVWEFDTNHRVYPPKKPGQRYSGGPPIYEKHFIEYRIVGEEGRSWLLQRGEGWRPTKVGKQQLGKKFFTDSQREGMIWAHEHRHAMIRMIERCDDVDVLKQIAGLVGYKYSAPDSAPSPES